MKINRPRQRVSKIEESFKIYIFCEGAKREKQYFTWFADRISQISIIVIAPDNKNQTLTDGAKGVDNSPSGILSFANEQFNSDKEDYDNVNDQIWLVFDTDPDKANTRREPIMEVRKQCQQSNWRVAESNPCFEVWLSCHLDAELTFTDEDKTVCKTWKQALDQNISGGFHSRKYAHKIQYAVENAERNYLSNPYGPATGATEVYLLGKEIIRFYGAGLGE